MIESFHTLDHERFQSWFEKKYPAVNLTYPMGSGKIRVIGDKFEFDIAGDDAPIMPVYHWDAIVDLIAWRPNQPDKWFFLNGRGDMSLGWEALQQALLYKQPLQVPDSPLAWLIAGAGSVPLGYDAMEAYRDLPEIVCSEAMADKMSKYLMRGPKWKTLTPST